MIIRGITTAGPLYSDHLSLWLAHHAPMADEIHVILFDADEKCRKICNHYKCVVHEGGRWHLTRKDDAIGAIANSFREGWYFSLDCDEFTTDAPREVVPYAEEQNASFFWGHMVDRFARFGLPTLPKKVEELDLLYPLQLPLQAFVENSDKAWLIRAGSNVHGLHRSKNSRRGGVKGRNTKLNHYRFTSLWPEQCKSKVSLIGKHQYCDAIRFFDSVAKSKDRLHLVQSPSLKQLGFDELKDHIGGRMDPFPQIVNGHNELDGFCDFISHEVEKNGIFVELGTFSGKSAATLARMRPDLEIFTIDIEPRPEAYERLAKYSNVKLIKGHDLVESARFEDGSLTGIYIDSDHSYHHVIKTLQVWAPKCNRSGIVSGHDYWLDHQGVIRACGDYFGRLPHRVYGDSSWVYRLT